MIRFGDFWTGVNLFKFHCTRHCKKCNSGWKVSLLPCPWRPSLASQQDSRRSHLQRLLNLSLKIILLVFVLYPCFRLFFILFFPYEYWLFSLNWVQTIKKKTRRENTVQYNTTLWTYPCGTVSLLDKYLIDDSWGVCYGYWLDQQFVATRNLIHVNTTTSPITVVVFIYKNE